MKKFLSNYKSTIILLVAIIVGAIVGIIFQEKATKLQPLGDIFLNLLFVIIVPLIFLTITTSIAKMENPKRLGKIMNWLTAKNKIVITITHDMEFVVKEFERVIVMAKKQKRRDASPKEIFWDEELLKFSNLKQPYICQFASLLGYRDVLTIDDMIGVTE